MGTRQPRLLLKLNLNFNRNPAFDIESLPLQMDSMSTYRTWNQTFASVVNVMSYAIISTASENFQDRLIAECGCAGLLDSYPIA